MSARATSKLMLYWSPKEGVESCGYAEFARLSVLFRIASVNCVIEEGFDLLKALFHSR
jgi:hypothetical protein